MQLPTMFIKKKKVYISVAFLRWPQNVDKLFTVFSFFGRIMWIASIVTMCPMAIIMFLSRNFSVCVPPRISSEMPTIFF